ncbi:bifunctional serine/threonine-protein kinase/formylglycine-generating enzyme family protein [Candidatus Uabimicrobium sp. HlEnr_7]|uniref:bifunctional serine/threonine-protein kinase/formylglycine-generating enzyme family protein n=1 Tax=Candidatus Uabimicrobium helgolandensis TaxID=3095367 RepID=UPI003558AA89
MSKSRDIHFGDTAVELGFITKEELQKYLDLQRLLKERGISEPLEKILVEEDAINGLDAKAILQQIPQQKIEGAKTTNLQQQTRSASVENIKPISSIRQFGRYEIKSILGQGGAATVYKVYDPRLDREAALKILTLGQAASPNQLKRFAIEIKSTARLQHPNIVTIYETSVENNIPYFIMDFVPGINLKQFVYRNKPSVDESVAIIMTIIQAIGYAHAQGVIHRDLKPENIMMENNKIPKIMDFGLAKIKDSDAGLSRTGEIMGTAKYMSPEQAEGLKDVDERTDLYAIGTILFEMLTLQTPFNGQSYIQVLNQVINTQPPSLCKINPQIPRELEIICLKALKKKIKNRYQNTCEFIEALQNFSSGKVTVPAQKTLNPKKTNVAKKITTRNKIRTDRKTKPTRQTQRTAAPKIVKISSRVTQRISKQNAQQKEKHTIVKVAAGVFVCALLVIAVYFSSKTNDHLHIDPNIDNNAQTIDNSDNNEKIAQKDTKNSQEVLQVSLENEAQSVVKTINFKQVPWYVWRDLNAIDSKYKNTIVWKRAQNRKKEIEYLLLREFSIHLVKLQKGHRISNRFWNTFLSNYSLFLIIGENNLRLKNAVVRLKNINAKIIENKYEKPQEKPQENPPQEVNTEKNKLETLDPAVYNFYFHKVLSKYISQPEKITKQIVSIKDPNKKNQIILQFLKIKKSLISLNKILRKNLQKYNGLITMKNGEEFTGTVKTINNVFFTIGNSKKLRYLNIKAQVIEKILQKDSSLFPGSISLIFFFENDFVTAKKYWDLIINKGKNHEIWSENLDFFIQLHKNIDFKSYKIPLATKIEQVIPVSINNISKESQKNLLIKVTDKEGKVIAKEKIDVPGKSDIAISLPIIVEKSCERQLSISLTAKEKIVYFETINFKFEREKYGIDSDVWEKLYYRHRGHEILDMTTLFWNKLSDAMQRNYVKTYQKKYAEEINKPINKILTVRGAQIAIAFIPPGRFWMGSPKTEKNRKSQEIRHKVVISKWFWIQRTEVTQDVWEKIAETAPWKSRKVRKNLFSPATYISYWHIKDTFLANAGKDKYKLPTEAQWEYACRAGSTRAFYWGSSVKKGLKYTSNKENYKKTTPPLVGKKKPNNWGLYDMLGNVAERCIDNVRIYSEKSQVDPRYVTSSTSLKVLRGGNYKDSIYDLRCAYRKNIAHDSRRAEVGFRIVYEEP